MPNTARAMSRATEIASEVSASITILALRTVSYPRPLDEPPMSIYFLRRTLWRFACGADVEIYLCRDIHDALRQVLAPHSTVFLGGARWRFARERRLARTLLRGGHAAFLIDSPARFPYVDE